MVWLLRPVRPLLPCHQLGKLLNVFDVLMVAFGLVAIVALYELRCVRSHWPPTTCY